MKGNTIARLDANHGKCSKTFGGYCTSQIDNRELKLVGHLIHERT